MVLLWAGYDGLYLILSTQDAVTMHLPSSHHFLSFGVQFASKKNKNKTNKKKNKQTNKSRWIYWITNCWRTISQSKKETMNCSPYRKMYLSVFYWGLCALLEIVLMLKALFDFPPLHNKTFIPIIRQV